MTIAPATSVSANRIPRVLLQDLAKVVAVRALPHRRGEPGELLRRDVGHPEGDLLEAGDHQPLALLDRLHEVRRLDERRVRAGVEPGGAAGQTLDVQLAAPEVLLHDLDDFELAARRRLQRGRDIEHLVVEEVEAGDGPGRPRY